MKIITLFLLACFASPLLAADTPITIGDTALTIPAPPGLAPVTPDMTKLNQILELYVAPQNQRFVSFIPVESMAAIQRGEAAAMVRSASLQAAKAVVNKTLTTTDFAQLKDAIRKQNAEFAKKAEDQVSGLMNQANKQMENQFNTKPGLSLNGMVPLPPYDETDRSLAYTMKVSLTANDANGQPVQNNGCVTVTFIFTRAKLLLLYVNGAKDDLEWTRQTAKTWADAILAANPSTAADAAKESSGPRAFRDWGSVSRSAVIGGLVGSLIGLIRWLIGKSKRKTGPPPLPS
jgi:hypothetical protein